jgi:mannose/fructose/N-acetylgalactosamine-specific phosphotransferase system component IIC
MTTHDPMYPSTPASGNALLTTMAVATVLLTLLIAGFCVVASWWLLPLLMIALLGTTCAIVALLVSVMGD